MVRSAAATPAPPSASPPSPSASASKSRPRWRSRPDMPAALPVSLEAIQAARERLAGTVLRTPLVRLNVDDAPAEIFLKLENLQPIGSFKLRGAGNRILQAGPEELAHGVWT